MKIVKRMFELNLSPKEVVWGKKILAVIVLPIMVFYTTSMNFVFLGMMNAQAADGSGTMTVDDDNVTAGGPAQNFKFTFDPSEDMDLGAIKITFPSPFPTPSLSGGDGAVTAEGKNGATLGTLERDSREITIPFTGMKANQYVVVNYNVTSIMPASPIGDVTFTTKSSLDGTHFSSLGTSRQATVTIEAGAVASYTVSTPSGVKVGNDFNVTITPKDAGGNTTNGGSVTLSAGGAGTLSGETTKSTTSGAATATLSYTKADTITIHATDGSATGDSSSFTVAGLTAPTFSSPGTPSGSSPNFSTSTNDATPKINWADVVGHNTTYAMKLKQKTDTCSSMTYSADLLLDENTGSTSEYQVQNDEALLSEAHYCAKVTASDDYGTPNTVDSYLDINLLTSKPATPSAVTIPATTDTPANTINIYNNENFDSTVTHVSTLDGGTAYIKMTDGLGHEVTDSASISGSVTSTNTTGGDANSLQQGSLNLYARVADAGNNESDWSGAQAVTKDTNSPNKPVLVAVTTPTNDDTPSFDWDDASGASHYYFQLDNDSNFSSLVKDIADHTTITSSGYTLSDALTTDGTYYWRVRSLDAAWNKSNWSSSGSFVFDGTHPDVALTYNPGHPVNDAGTMNVTATFTEDMKEGASAPTIAVDYADGTCADLSATPMTKSSASVWTYGVDVPTCNATTTATVTITGQDLAGNSNNTATNNTFAVDNQKPTISSGTVLPNPSAAGTLNVSLTFSEAMNQAVAPTVSVVTASDAQTLTVTGSFADATHWTGTATVSSGDANGTATLKVSGASDIAGNVMDANTNVATTLIDTAGPTFTINDGVAASPVKTDTINVTVADAGAGVTSRYYGFSADTTCDASDTITSSFSSATPFDIAGNHTDYLCVKATDAVGNTSYQTVGRLNTDNTEPILSPVQIVSNNGTNTSNAKNGDVVTLSFTSSETISTPTVTIAGHAAASVTNISGNAWTATYTMTGGDTNGAVLFTVNFSDIATNAGTQVATTTDGSNVTFDKSAPSVSEVVSDATSDTQAISVSYTSSDAGPAGVGFAKLFYRIDGGAWTVFDVGTADDYQTAPGDFSFTAPQAGNYDFYVRVKDNAGNESASDPVGDVSPHSLTDARPTTVYVDDDYTSGSAGGHVWSWDAFKTIQNGVDKIRSASGNTVNVAAGTYTESQILIDKPLTLQGAESATTTIDGGGTSTGGLVKITASGTVTLSGFTIQNTNNSDDHGHGVYVNNAGVTVNISDNAIKNVGPVGINVNTASAVHIEGNVISALYSTPDVVPNGIQIGYPDGVGITGTINNNEISGCSWVGYDAGLGYDGATTTGAGILIMDTAAALEISHNVIHNNNVGIDIEAGASTSIAGNDIHDNAYGVVSWNANPSINTNKIVNNSTGSVYRTTAGVSSGTLDATLNWWGSDQRSTIEGKLFGSVNFTPWYMASDMLHLSDEDTTGPTVVLTNSISGRTEVRDADNVTITATFSDDNRLDTGVNPTITISNGGVTGASMTATVGSEIWTYLWNVPSGDFASASVTIAAKDIVGHDAQAPTGINSYTIDNTAPTSTLSGTPGNPTNATALDVTVGGLGVVAYKYKLDGGSYDSAIPIATHITNSGLAEGAHTLYAKGIDTAGNEQPTETTHTWTIDTTVPSVALSYSVASPVKAGTETITATYTEDVKAGETPEISINQPGSTNISNVAMTIGADRQHWTYAYTVNAANGGAYVDGTATVSLSTNHDEAGNTAGSPSNSTFVIDTTAPVATLNALTPDPSNDNTPTFTGNVTDSASILASIQYRYQRGSDGWSGWNDVTITDGVLDETSEDFSFTTTTLLDGSYAIELKGSDRAGNYSNTATDTFSIDVVAPTVRDTYITVSGNSGIPANTFKRGDTVHAVWNNTGTGDNNSDVASVSMNFSEFGGGAAVAATNTAGVWSADYILPVDVNRTGVKVSVTAVDTATNPTTTADDTTYNVDTQSPAAPSIDMSDPVNDANQAAITLAGGGDANGTLNYSIVSSGGAGTVSGTIAINGSGAYSKTDVNVSTLPDGTLTATVYVTDTAGNIGSSITDTSAKDVSHPTITDVNSNHDDGSFKAGEVIDIDVTFSENVTSGSVTVNLDSGGSCSFLITNSASGTCNYTVLAGQNSADLTTSSISGTIADQHSNAMTVFTPATNLATHKAIIVDTVAPGAPTVTVPAGPITINADNYSIQGVTEANALVKIYKGAAFVASQQLTGGATAYSISVPLSQDATNIFTAKATDAAGNEGDGTAASIITEDSTAPTVDAGANQVKNALFSQGATTSDNFGQMTYAWSKQSGPGTVTFSTATSEDTNVSASTDGTYVIRLTVTDAAGNSNFDEFTLTWDTTAPTSAASAEEYDRYDGINVGFSTGADLSGVAQVQLWYKFGDGGTWTNTGQTSMATSGTFAFTPSGDGTYYFATKAIDNATNAEADPTGSGDDSMIYDTVNPGAPTNFAVTVGEHAPYDTWSATANTAISWTVATDATSGSDGYNVLWNQTADTELVDTKTTHADGSEWIEESVTTSSKTFGSNGFWYFHIRTRDNAGNWAGTVHYGPFKIDTTDPSISHSAVSSATAGEDIHVSANVTDTDGSGVSSVKVFYKHHGDSGYTEKTMTCDGSWHCTYDIPDEQNSSYVVHYYIEATDSVGNSVSKPETGDYTVDIVPAALDHFTFIRPSGSKAAGSNFAIAIEARDEFNNTAEQFDGAGHEVSFTTDQTPISVFVNGGSGNTSGVFDQGSWIGEIRFGTGGVTPSDNNIVVTATNTGSPTVSGNFTINTTGTNFGAAAATGTVEGAQTGGGEGVAPEGAGAEGEGTSPQVLGEETSAGGEQGTGAPVPEGAQNPWRQAAPYVAAGAIVLAGIWLWLKRRGGGVGGSTPTITGMMFSSLKTASSKIRMFLW